MTAIRFTRRGAHYDDARPPDYRPWRPLTGAWRTSMDRAEYLDGVVQIRERIAAGTVYQVNLPDLARSAGGCLSAGARGAAAPGQSRAL